MTKKKDTQLIIEQEPKQQCDFCGLIEELRPYGPNGECICFKCMMKDESAGEKQFEKRIAGEHPYDQAYINCQYEHHF